MMLHRTAGTQPRGGIRYHHIGAPQINGVDVEAHFRPLFLDSPLRNWRLQRWFLDNAQFGLLDAKVADAVLPVPTVSFNAVYQLCHIYRHLFDEGIGLRLLLDYYFVLRALHIEQGELSGRTESMAQFSCKREEKLRACSQVIPNRGSSESRVNVRIHFAESRTRKTLVNAAEIRRSQWAEGMGIAVKSNAEIMRTLGRFGMKKFAGAVMYVLQTVFAMPSAYMICEPDEKEGKFLLGEIMQAGNFGQYDERIKRSRRSGDRSSAGERTVWGQVPGCAKERPFWRSRMVWGQVSGCAKERRLGDRSSAGERTVWGQVPGCAKERPFWRSRMVWGQVPGCAKERRLGGESTPGEGKVTARFLHAWEKTKHNLRLLTHYPEEVICEPFFRVYHWVWRRLELWRY